MHAPDLFLVLLLHHEDDLLFLPLSLSFCSIEGENKNKESDLLDALRHAHISVGLLLHALDDGLLHVLVLVQQRVHSPSHLMHGLRRMPDAIAKENEALIHRKK